MNQTRLYIGTSGWAYPTWKPGFYPAGVSARKFLDHYSSRLNSVEVNYTFRSLPSAAQLQGWIDATPQDFRFSFKAHQRITHLRRLRDCGGPCDELLSALAPVVKANKQGALLLQFPPNFRASAKGKDKQLNQSAFAAFLAESQARLNDAGWRIACEFRDASWFTEEIYDILRRFNVALCAAEDEKLVSPAVDTANFSYARLRLADYSEARLEELGREFEQVASKQDVFAYFKHEDAPEGPLRAERLSHLCRDMGCR